MFNISRVSYLDQRRNWSLARNFRRIDDLRLKITDLSGKSTGSDMINVWRLLKSLSTKSEISDAKSNFDLECSNAVSVPSDPTVCVNLDSECFNVVCSVRASCEVGKIELNLIPAVVQAHRHCTDERFHPCRWLIVWCSESSSNSFIVQYRDFKSKILLHLKIISCSPQDPSTNFDLVIRMLLNEAMCTEFLKYTYPSWRVKFSAFSCKNFVLILVTFLFSSRWGAVHLLSG